MKLQPMVGSKYLERKWRDKEFQDHQRRIREMRSEVTLQITQTGKPYEADLAKRVQHGNPFQESKRVTNNCSIGRYNEIETENKKLLNKLSDIMRTSTTALSPRKPPPQETIFRKSLNRDSRRRELVKITMENQFLLKRLAEKQSSYNVQKLEEEYQKKERLMKEVMCEYPFVLDKPPTIDNTFQIQAQSPRPSLTAAGGVREFLKFRGSQDGLG